MKACQLTRTKLPQKKKKKKKKLLDTKNETAQISLTCFLSSFYFLSAEGQLLESHLLKLQLLNMCRIHVRQQKTKS